MPASRLLDFVRPQGARVARESLRGIGLGRTCLVAVSGGRDSVALLHFLCGCGFRRLVVCHFNHRLRPDAAGDERFVRALARRAGCPFVRGSANVRRLARAAGCSLEEAAREARYAFFARVAAEHRCRTVFLGHHADDRVETFLFNLLRGAGPEGLSGMRPRSNRRCAGRQLLLVRPLLGIFRGEIDRYAKAAGLAYREDESNASDEFTRNRIRRALMPALGRVMGREVRGALWRAAELLSAEAELLPPPGGAARRARLSCAELRGLPLGQQRRLLREWLARRGVAGCGFEEVEAVRGLLDVATGPAKVNLPGARHARRRAGMLSVTAGVRP